MDQLKLIIPVYLNQRIVFDHMAMLQDGLSTVTRISESENSKDIEERRYGAAFGLSKAFSTLLRIDISGEANKAEEESTQRAKSEEKIHTPASLLYKLRNKLNDIKNNPQISCGFHCYIFSSALLYECRKKPLLKITIQYDLQIIKTYKKPFRH